MTSLTAIRPAISMGTAIMYTRNGTFQDTSAIRPPMISRTTPPNPMKADWTAMTLRLSSPS